MKPRVAAAVLLLSGSLLVPAGPANAGPPATATGDNAGRLATTRGAVDRDLAVTRAQRALAADPGLVHGSPHDGYVVDRVIIDPDGATHVRFDRTHHGLPVLGGDFVVHHDARGTARRPSVTLKRPLSISRFPAVTAQQALAVAQKAFGGTSHELTGQRLVVDAIGDSAGLAWETVLEGIGPDSKSLSRLHVLVDAHRGSVRQTFDEFPAGTGHGVHNGTVFIGTQQSGSLYLMRDPLHGDMKTCDAYHNSGVQCSDFIDFDDVWGDGTQSDRASAGVDAHYGAARTYDYYSNVLNRNGIWGDGKGATLRVHASKNWFNAQWIGDGARFGDGVGGQDPLVTLDIVGHELSHGLTSATAGLIYSNESGGLNEATSDIFGSMVEFYANNPNDPRDYKVGEELAYFQPNDALRYTYQPSLDGISPDCWYAGIGNLDVHYSSGVANHFFFLAAEGSGPSLYGTSPTCDGSTVVGIGRTKAAKIWYKALDAYFVSNETYADARLDTLAAAEDLYGECSTEYMTVRAAWAAVGVGTHSSICLRRLKLYLVDSCWPCSPIPDPGPLRSRIEIGQVVTGQIEVGVDIAHSRRGDLQIDLIAPDGRSFRLKSATERDRGEDVNEVYRVPLAEDYAPGVWMLQITDNVREHAGALEGWSMLV